MERNADPAESLMVFMALLTRERSNSLSFSLSFSGRNQSEPKSWMPSKTDSKSLRYTRKSMRFQFSHAECRCGSNTRNKQYIFVATSQTPICQATDSVFCLLLQTLFFHQENKRNEANKGLQKRRTALTHLALTPKQEEKRRVNFQPESSELQPSSVHCWVCVLWTWHSQMICYSTVTHTLSQWLFASEKKNRFSF